MTNILILWLFVFSAVVSPCNLICWESEEKLNWDQFLGEPDYFNTTYGDSAQAVSNLTIVMGLDSNNNYTVNAVFNKNLSWYTEQNDLLLQHEQGHFDLTEIYARVLRRKIEVNEGKNDFDINLLYEEVIIELDSVSEKYDSETLHGSILVQQKKWNILIEEQLKKLCRYSVETSLCPCG